MSVRCPKTNRKAIVPRRIFCSEACACFSPRRSHLGAPQRTSWSFVFNPKSHLYRRSKPNASSVEYNPSSTLLPTATDYSNPENVNRSQYKTAPRPKARQEQVEGPDAPSHYKISKEFDPSISAGHFLPGMVLYPTAMMLAWICSSTSFVVVPVTMIPSSARVWGQDRRGVRDRAGEPMTNTGRSVQLGPWQ